MGRIKKKQKIMQLKKSNVFIQKLTNGLFSAYIYIYISLWNQYKYIGLAFFRAGLWSFGIKC